MEQHGQYFKTSIYPKNSMRTGTQLYGPGGGLKLTPGTIRLINLGAADKGEKISLAVQKLKTNEYQLFGQKITKADSINDKWRMVQLNYNSFPFGGDAGIYQTGNVVFYLYNIMTGLCLARGDNYEPVLIDVSELAYLDENGQLMGPKRNQLASGAPGWRGLDKAPFGLWTLLGERGIQLVSPDFVQGGGTSDSVCLDQNGIVKTKCTGSDCSKEQCNTTKSFNQLCNANNYYLNGGGGHRFNGRIFLKLNDDYTVTIDKPDDSILNHLYCTGTSSTTQGGNKKIEWYVLVQQDRSNIGYSVPVRTSMSLGEFFSWSPDKNVDALFSVAREKLRDRFIDMSTQIVPEQSQFPTIAPISQDPGSQDQLVQNYGGLLLPGSINYHWQYQDIYAYFGGDQGNAPPEFKNITPDNMGVMGDLSILGPGPGNDDISSPGGKYSSNVTSLWHYLDGKRAANQGGRVTIPPPWLVNAAHKNGVKVFGCIFFQEIYYGGAWGWWAQFVQDIDLTSQRMIDIANYYGFDGWCFNIETGPVYNPIGLQNDYPGNVIRGNNFFTNEQIDAYWCRSISGSLGFPWVELCGVKGRACRCAPSIVNNSFTPNDTWPYDSDPNENRAARNTCQLGIDNKVINWGSKDNKYEQGCNQGGPMRRRFIELLKLFKVKRNKLGLKIENLVYDTVQGTSPFSTGINIPHPQFCPKGVDQEPLCYSNWDAWYDEEVGDVVDYLFTMRSGIAGGINSIDPRGITSTFILSKENTSLSNEITHFQKTPESYKTYNPVLKEHFSENTWPKDTGPQAGGNYCPGVIDTKNLCASKDGKWDLDKCPRCMYTGNYTGDCPGCVKCGEGMSCLPIDPKDNKGVCVPNLYSDYMCNWGKQPANIDKMSSNRAQSYFQALQIEGIGSGMGYWRNKDSKISTLEALDRTLSMNSKIDDLSFGDNTSVCWDTFLYCGTQSGDTDSCILNSTSNKGKILKSYASGGSCKNAQTAVEKPLAGLNIYYLDTVFRFGLPFTEYSTYDDIIQEQINKLQVFWTAKRDLTASNRLNTGLVADKWKGMAHFTTERSCINTYPFYTCFSLGFGKDFYIDGRPSNMGHWNQQSLSTLSPTWMWWPEEAYLHSSKLIDITFDFNTVYHRGNSLKVALKPNVTDDKVECIYRLYKTQLTVDKSCYLSVVYGIHSINTDTELKIGLSFSEKPDTPTWFPVQLDDSNEWKQDIFQVNSTSTIVTVWLQVSLSHDTHIFLGELCILKEQQSKLDKVPYSVQNRYTTTETRSMSCNLKWNCIPGVEYFNIYMDNQLIGQAYQGTLANPDKLKIPMMYNIQNANPESSFVVQPINNFIDIGKPKSKNNMFIGILIMLLIGLLIYLLSKRSKYAIILILMIVILSMVYFSRKIKSQVKLTYVNNKQIIGGKQVASVTMDKNQNCIDICKSKGVSYGSFNTNTCICYTPYFESSIFRIERYAMCKSNVFITTFDDAHVKCWKWIVDLCDQKKYPFKISFFYNTIWADRDIDTLKDYIKRGHTIDSHTDTHICMCSCGQPGGWSLDRCTYELSKCAYDIRNKIYNDPERELSLAYPHGAPPLANPDCHEGNCGPQKGSIIWDTYNVMKSEYIAARGVEHRMFNDWPPEKLPDDWIGGDMDPAYDWPITIEMNPDPSENYNDFCNNMIDTYNKAMQMDGAIIITNGHAVNPTYNGVDYPCDKDTAKQMGSKYSGDANKYICPSKLANEMKSCWVNSTDPKNPKLQKPKDKNCDHCCDACWNPIPGSCLIRFYDEVMKSKDKFWFAGFTEHVQYLNNRKSSTLELMSVEGNTLHLRLKTNKIYKYPLTLSFDGENISSIIIDGKSMRINKISGKGYTVFQPLSYSEHHVQVQYDGSIQKINKMCLKEADNMTSFSPENLKTCN
jgi:endo-beta-N-acetylglucosaminidase D